MLALPLPPWPRLSSSTGCGAHSSAAESPATPPPTMTTGARDATTPSLAGPPRACGPARATPEGRVVLSLCPRPRGLPAPGGPSTALSHVTEFSVASPPTRSPAPDSRRPDGNLCVHRGPTGSDGSHPGGEVIRVSLPPSPRRQARRHHAGPDGNLCSRNPIGSDAITRPEWSRSFPGISPTPGERAWGRSRRARREPLVRDLLGGSGGSPPAGEVTYPSITPLYKNFSPLSSKKKTPPPGAPGGHGGADGTLWFTRAYGPESGGSGPPGRHRVLTGFDTGEISHWVLRNLLFTEGLRTRIGRSTAQGKVNRIL